MALFEKTVVPSVRSFNTDALNKVSLSPVSEESYEYLGPRRRLSER